MFTRYSRHQIWDVKFQTVMKSFNGSFIDKEYKIIITSRNEWIFIESWKYRLQLQGKNPRQSYDRTDIFICLIHIFNVNTFFPHTNRIVLVYISVFPLMRGMRVNCLPCLAEWKKCFIHFLSIYPWNALVSVNGILWWNHHSGPVFMLL